MSAERAKWGKAAYLHRRIPRGRAHANVDLVVDSPTPLKELPVSRTGAHVECTREEVGADVGVLVEHGSQHLAKANVEADGQGDRAESWR